MRKKIINDYTLKCMSNEKRGVATFLMDFVRSDHRTGKNKERALQDVHKFGRECNQVVLINDLRKEVEMFGATPDDSRHIVTSGMLIDEILQTNRGQQNYEYEKNKFFIQDGCSRGRGRYHSQPELFFMDLLWYMKENDLNALVLEKPVTELDTSFLSERYNSIHNKAFSRIKSKSIKMVVEAIEDFIEKKNKETKHSFNYDSYISSYDLEGNYPDTIKSVMSDFFSYRRYLDGDDKPLSPQKWLEKQYRDDDKSYYRDTVTSMMATLKQHFGYLKKEDDDCVGYAFNGTIPAKDREIIVYPSQYKRSGDWTVDDKAFINSEVLKFRRLMMEGTYNEN